MASLRHAMPIVEHERGRRRHRRTIPGSPWRNSPFGTGSSSGRTSLSDQRGARWSVYRRRTMRIRSGITRPFDRSLASNRFVLLASPVSGAVAGLVTLAMGDGWRAAIPHGFSAGGATFLAWAIVRELHPDRPGLSVVAAMLAPLGLVLGTPDLLASTVALLVARVVAGTTGRRLRWPDVVIVVGFAVPVAVRSSGAGVLTASAIALFGILLLQDHRRRELLIAAVIVTGLAGYSSWDLKVGFDVGTLAPAAVGMVALLGRGVSPLPPTAAAERSHHIECAPPAATPSLPHWPPPSAAIRRRWHRYGSLLAQPRQGPLDRKGDFARGVVGAASSIVNREERWTIDD